MSLNRKQFKFARKMVKTRNSLSQDVDEIQQRTAKKNSIKIKEKYY